MSNEDKILTDMGEYAAIVYEGNPEYLFALFDDPQCDDEEYLEKLERAIQLIMESGDTHFILTNHGEHGREEVNRVLAEFGEQMQRVLVLEQLRYGVLGNEWEPYADLDTLLAGYYIRNH